MNSKVNAVFFSELRNSIIQMQKKYVRIGCLGSPGVTGFRLPKELAWLGNWRYGNNKASVYPEQLN